MPCDPVGLESLRSKERGWIWAFSVADSLTVCFFLERSESGDQRLLGLRCLHLCEVGWEERVGGAYAVEGAEGEGRRLREEGGPTLLAGFSLTV